jgi:hypothetical protein
MKEVESRLASPMRVAIPVIREVFNRYAPKDIELEFTAGQEWYNHARWSLHHSGNAVDIRTRRLPDHGLGLISTLLGYYLQEALDARLGKNKYLVLVNDQGPKFPHIHVQYNPGERMSTPGDYELKRGPRLV